MDVSLCQRPLSHAIDDALYQRLLSSAPTICSYALALSCGLPHAGDWLNVVPSPSLGLHLQDKEFQYCLHYWLGLPLHSSSYIFLPECGGIIRLDVVEMETEFPATILSGISCSMLLSWLPWLLPKRPPA